MGRNEAAGIVRMIDGNSAYRGLYLKLIEFCRIERPEDELIAFCEAEKTSVNQIQSAAGIVSTLVGAGALERLIYLDGAAYEGTLEELQGDAGIPEEAEVAFAYRATQEGLDAAALKEDQLSFARLIRENSQREAAFLLVLELCAQGEGASTRQIQDALKRADLLETEEARGIDALHASYFTGSLEHIGALVWNRSKWVATEKGLDALGR